MSITVSPAKGKIQLQREGNRVVYIFETEEQAKAMHDLLLLAQRTNQQVRIRVD